MERRGANKNNSNIDNIISFNMKIMNSSRLVLSFCLAAVSSCAINSSSRSLAFIIPHQRTSSTIRLFGRRGGGGGGKKDMKKTYTKSNLPEKTCVVCGRPFAWRKK